MAKVIDRLLLKHKFAIKVADARSQNPIAAGLGWARLYMLALGEFAHMEILNEDG